MLSSKNVTSYVSADRILHEMMDGDNKFFSPDLSYCQIVHVTKANYVTVDFKPTGELTVTLPDGTIYRWNLVAFTQHGKEELLVALLDDKTIIGHDLILPYSLFHVMCKSWKPACTLDTAMISRALSIPIHTDETPLEQLYALSGERNYADALESLIDTDMKYGGVLFDAVEPLQHALAQVFAVNLELLADKGLDSEVAFCMQVNHDNNAASVLSASLDVIHIFDASHIAVVQAEIDHTCSASMGKLKEIGQ